MKELSDTCFVKSVRNGNAKQKREVLNSNKAYIYRKDSTNSNDHHSTSSWLLLIDQRIFQTQFLIHSRLQYTILDFRKQ